MYQRQLAGAGEVTPGKVYNHRDSREVIVVFLDRRDERWSNYLVLSAQNNDPNLGCVVKMEDWHVTTFYQELT